MYDMAACADSCITSPSLPVKVSLPLPSTTVASVLRMEPPTSVQAKPVTRPTSLFSWASVSRNFSTPRNSPIFSAVMATEKPAAAFTLQVAHARLAGIGANDLLQGLVGELNVLAGQTRLFHLLAHQELFGD